MLEIVLVSVVALGAVVEVIRNYGIKDELTMCVGEEQQEEDEMSENTKLITETVLCIKENDLSVGEWDSYTESEKKMILAAMEEIDSRDHATLESWNNITENERIIISRSQRYAAKMDNVVKSLVDNVYPNERLYRKYDDELKAIADEPNPSIEKLRRLPSWYLAHIN